MKVAICYWLSLAVLLGSVMLALRWLWEAWLMMIGVDYEAAEDEED